MHVGYAHQLATNTAVSVDYTHIIGRHEFRRINLNPIVNGSRLLAPDFMRVYGIPDVLNAINILTTDNKSRYDALTVQFQRRMPRVTLQAHYTLRGRVRLRRIDRRRVRAPRSRAGSFDQFAKGEWGPTGNDERHRAVVMGVFDLAYGIQLSPVFQVASARPHNADGRTAISIATAPTTTATSIRRPAQQVAVNSQRGDPTTVVRPADRRSSSRSEVTARSASLPRRSTCSTRRTSATAIPATGAARPSGSPPGSFPGSAMRGRCSWVRGSCSDAGSSKCKIQNANTSQLRDATSHLFAFCILNLALTIAPPSVSAQGRRGGAPQPPATPLSRTADGQPDVHGHWGATRTRRTSRPACRTRRPTPSGDAARWTRPRPSAGLSIRLTERSRTSSGRSTSGCASRRSAAASLSRGDPKSIRDIRADVPA